MKMFSKLLVVIGFMFFLSAPAHAGWGHAQGTIVGPRGGVVNFNATWARPCFPPPVAYPMPYPYYPYYGGYGGGYGYGGGSFGYGYLNIGGFGIYGFGASNGMGGSAWGGGFYF